MWVRLSKEENKPGIVLFDYDPSRSEEVPMKLLDGFNGYLQVDGYGGYKKVCVENNLTRVGCWAHARRKFFEASKVGSGKNLGKHAINLIQKLYDIEKRKSRKQETEIALDKIKLFLEENKNKAPPNSLISQAISYTLNEWGTLTSYLADEKIRIDNNLVEGAIRPFTIGRKNWLFSATTDGADASALFYSLIETAKLNKINPQTWLTKVLKEICYCKTLEDFEKLLPLR
jgi:hypothetical protein